MVFEPYTVDCDGVSAIDILVILNFGFLNLITSKVAKSIFQENIAKLNHSYPSFLSLKSVIQMSVVQFLTVVKLSEFFHCFYFGTV